MDISTRQVIKQTLATTNAHVELDHLVDYEEKIADVSIEYKAYNDYDVEEIPIIDASVIEDLKEKTDLMRLTHENVSNSSSYFKDLAQCYVDNNMYPVPFFFRGPSSSDNQESDSQESESKVENYEQSIEEMNMSNNIANAITEDVSAHYEGFDVSVNKSTIEVILDDNTELTHITLPVGTGKSIKLTGNIKSGTEIIYNDTSALYITNTSTGASDLKLTSKGVAYVMGNYNNVDFNGANYVGNGALLAPKYSNVYGEFHIADDVEKPVSISANFVNPRGNEIVSNTDKDITISAKNEDANIIINCPNSTVTLAGSYNDVEANVSDNTLKLDIKAHIKNLHMKHGNILIDNGKEVDAEGNPLIEKMVDKIDANYNYKVSHNKAEGKLPDIPKACEYTLTEDKNTWVTFAATATGDTVINLNKHKIEVDGNYAIMLKGITKAPFVTCEINGDGEIINNSGYGLQVNTTNAVFNINGGKIVGTTHTVYAYKGFVNIYGGEFICNTSEFDAKGHAKFMLNCYDSNYPANANFKVYGGKFHNFNPAEVYSEKTAPISYVAEGYESVCIDEANQIYEVRKI